MKLAHHDDDVKIGSVAVDALTSEMLYWTMEIHQLRRREISNRSLPVGDPEALAEYAKRLLRDLEHGADAERWSAFSACYTELTQIIDLIEWPLREILQAIGCDPDKGAETLTVPHLRVAAFVLQRFRTFLLDVRDVAADTDSKAIAQIVDASSWEGTPAKDAIKRGDWTDAFLACTRHAEVQTVLQIREPLPLDIAGLLIAGSELGEAVLRFPVDPRRPVVIS